MPKGRYAAMRASLGPKGPLALDMMLMTATVQANLDWSDERDLAHKVRAATAVSPIVSAIFANSPIRHGKVSPYRDFRYQVWRECDPARCGLLEQMLRPDWGYRTYVEWALDVPMLFVRRGTEYIDAAGQTFRQFLDTGRLANGEKLEPIMSIWVDHLSTLFPEVRVKRVLEVRGADMVPPPYLLGLPAIWTGLLYDEGAAEAAWQLTKSWTFSARLDFQGEVAHHALRARGPDGRTAHDLARELLAIARAGLKGWEKRSGRDESAHLSPLDDIVATGKTLADRAVEVFEASHGDPRSLVKLWQIA